MSRLEELEKAVDEALEVLQKANDAWDAADADDYDADAAWDAYALAADAACYKARQELRDYKKESGL